LLIKAVGLRRRRPEFGFVVAIIATTGGARRPAPTPLTRAEYEAHMHRVLERRGSLRVLLTFIAGGLVSSYDLVYPSVSVNRDPAVIKQDESGGQVQYI
jgi:hypothetical protein